MSSTLKDFIGEVFKYIIENGYVAEVDPAAPYRNVMGSRAKYTPKPGESVTVIAFLVDEATYELDDNYLMREGGNVSVVFTDPTGRSYRASHPGSIGSIAAEAAEPTGSMLTF